MRRERFNTTTKSRRLVDSTEPRFANVLLGIATIDSKNTKKKLVKNIKLKGNITKQEFDGLDEGAKVFYLSLINN